MMARNYWLWAAFGVLAVATFRYGIDAFRPLSELGVLDGEAIVAAGNAQFTAAGWRARPPHVRGAMAADLFSNERFLGHSNTEVFEKLGESDCYHLDESMPCYIIELDGRPFDLIFMVNRGDGSLRVTRIRLAKGPRVP